MQASTRQWLSAVAAALWLAFFVTLIFRPNLVRRYPPLAALVIGGVAWWGLQARRTRRQEKEQLLDSESRP